MSCRVKEHLTLRKDNRSAKKRNYVRRWPSRATVAYFCSLVQSFFASVGNRVEKIIVHGKKNDFNKWNKESLGKNVAAFCYHSIMHLRPC